MAEVVEDEKKLVEFVLERFEKMREARADFEGQWEDDDEAYITPFKSNDQYAADVNLPVEFSHVQHSMAEVMDSPPNVIFVPKNKAGRDKVSIAQAVWEFAWDKADTQRQMFWLYLSIFVHGAGVWFEGYKRVTRSKFSKIGLNAEDMKRLGMPENLLDRAKFPEAFDESELTEDVVVEYDDVYGESVPLKEFYFDECAKTFWEPTHSKDARDCIRQRFYAVSAFHQAWSKYDRHSDVEDTAINSDQYKNSEEARREVTDNRKIEVLEYWNRETQSYIIVVNRALILNGTYGEKMLFEHGRLPFVVCPCFPVEGSPYGLGLVALLRGLRTQEDLVVNIGLDQGKNTIQPPLLKSSNMEVMDEEWYAGMGYILNINGSIEDIKEMPVGQLSNNFFTLLDRMENYEVLATGQDVRSLIKSEPTAFQQANKKEISLKRLKVILQFINWEALAQMVYIRYSNIRQIYSLPDFEEITGEDVDGDGNTGAVASGRTIRVENKQVVEKLHPDTGERMGRGLVDIDGFTDFFNLEEDELEDYDIRIDFQLNTSKELKKLRFQEAINVLPMILQVAQLNLFNITEFLDYWAEIYEMPTTILNKDNAATAQQIPLSPGSMSQISNPAGAVAKLSPGQGTMTGVAENITDFAQQDFNMAQPR